jgi:hypothetical protein
VKLCIFSFGALGFRAVLTFRKPSPCRGDRMTRRVDKILPSDKRNFATKVNAIVRDLTLKVLNISHITFPPMRIGKMSFVASSISLRLSFFASQDFL